MTYIAAENERVKKILKMHCILIMQSGDGDANAESLKSKKNGKNKKYFDMQSTYTFLKK